MDNIFGSAAVYNNMFNSLNAFYHGNIFEVDNGAPHNVNFLPERVIPYPKWWANLITARAFRLVMTFSRGAIRSMRRMMPGSSLLQRFEAYGLHQQERSQELHEGDRRWRSAGSDRGL